MTPQEGIIKMFQYRGYTDITEARPYVHAIDMNDRRVSAYVTTKTLGKADIKNLLEKIDTDNQASIILVAPGCSSQAVACAKEQGLHCQHLLPSFVSICIMEHKMVPKYTIVHDATDIEAMVRAHGALNRFPKMKGDDPVAKYMGFLPGQLLRIVRFSSNMGQSVYYRVVID